MTISCISRSVTQIWLQMLSILMEIITIPVCLSTSLHVTLGNADQGCQASEWHDFSCNPQNSLGVSHQQTMEFPQTFKFLLAFIPCLSCKQEMWQLDTMQKERMLRSLALCSGVTVSGVCWLGKTLHQVTSRAEWWRTTMQVAEGVL